MDLERRDRAAARGLVAGGEEATWEAPELPLDDGQVLVLDAEDPFPTDEWPVYRAD